MTNNIDRAADIIDAHEWSRFGGSIGEQTAAALHEAGLLAPDLPKPTMAGEDGYAVWNLEHIDISADSECQTVYVDGNDLTPDQALAEAAALLAAADLAEGVGRADA